MTAKRTLSAEEAKEALATRPIAMTGLTGAAGEYFVAAELSLRGWLATVTIKNAPGTDVLAQKLSTGATVAIQTKTAGYGNDFQLRAKCEQPTNGTGQWYVFVKLHQEGIRPSFYIVPHNVVAGAIYAAHRRWLSEPGRGGRTRRDNSMRQMRAVDIAGYEDRWDLLDDPAEGAPLLINPWFTDVVGQFGLPPGHPGWPTQTTA